MNIVLYSTTPAYSGAGLLSEAIKKYNGSIQSFFDNKDPEHFFEYVPYASWNDHKALKSAFNTCDICVVCGGKAFMRLKNIVSLNKKQVIVILTDSYACRYYKEIRSLVKKSGAKAMAMYDLFPYFDGIRPIPYIPPTIMQFDDGLKEIKGRVIICHSPFQKYERNTKGSKEIDCIVKNLSKKYDINYLLLIDKTREETLNLKRSSDIFIDQIVLGNPNVPQVWGKIKYEGALGKSGCEAMGMNTMVMSGCKPVITQPYFENPPAVFSDYGHFQSVLEHYIKNKQEISSKIKEQVCWSKKYLDPVFIAKHVLEL